MKRYGVYKLGDKQPIHEFLGDDMTQREQQVHIWKDGDLVVALNVEVGHFVAQAVEQPFSDPRVPGAWR
jgi:hypothetical protein